MTQVELQKRQNFRCTHGHTGLSHPQCFAKDNCTKERIGFFDIEASGLQANFAIILSYCIKEENGKILKRTIEPEAIKKGIYDKDLVRQLCIDLRKYDRICTYYGTKFDIPFCRTRALKHKLDFPTYMELKHTDIYLMAKYKMNLNSRRLGVVCDFLDIEAKGHPLNPDIWLGCLSGNRKALAWVLTHNIEDVVSLEKLWKRINKFVRINQTTI